MVQLGFEKAADFPDEDTFWNWLAGTSGVTDNPDNEMDYWEREVIERKYYICMKEEEGAKWVEEQFGEEGILYSDSNHQDIPIKAKQMGDIWKFITVRGVTPVTPIETIAQHFRQYGEVKDISYVVKGEARVRGNKVTLKLKLEEDKQVPVFIWSPLREGFYERWEVSYYGSPKVCLRCFQQGHIKRDCDILGPTMTTIREGGVTWAQVLGGQAPPQPPPVPKPVVPPQQPPPVSRPPATSDTTTTSSTEGHTAGSSGNTVITTEEEGENWVMAGKRPGRKRKLNSPKKTPQKKEKNSGEEGGEDEEDDDGLSDRGSEDSSESGEEGDKEGEEKREDTEISLILGNQEPVHADMKDKGDQRAQDNQPHPLDTDSGEDGGGEETDGLKQVASEGVRQTKDTEQPPGWHHDDGDQ